MKRGLGEAERRLFAYVQMRGQTTLRTGELGTPLGLTAPRERNLLSRLAKAGWIVRVRRGLYLVRGKIAIRGAGPVDVTPDHLGPLRRQLHAELRPVLREQEFARFDLDRAVDAVRAIARGVA